MNKRDEEELSGMSKTEKKMEGKVFKNGEKQEVSILQNKIQLILTSYNIKLFGRIGNFGIRNSYPTK